MSIGTKLGILAAGGPAPGINSVIAAATIRARLSGLEVVGIRDGFKWLMRGDTSHVTDLTIENVGRIHYRGGSFIGIARDNPTREPEKMPAVLASLDKLGVEQLITIGGDGTAYTAMGLAKAAKHLRIAHVPKTIDNDLDLPHGVPTFGYETARQVGVRIVKDLQTDARTTSRWYFVVTMGRAAGHLALGIGKAAGAVLTLIPEELDGERVPLQRIVDLLVTSIIKRLEEGREDGTAILAEGLIERLYPEELAGLPEIERDIHGNMRLAEVSFGDLVKRRVQKELSRLGIKMTIVAKNIGYELRCADPIPFDMEYTRDLGYCAAKYLLEGGKNVLVSVQHGKFVPIPFEHIVDPETNRTRVRMVDTDTEMYKIARRYMIRLRRDDFLDHELIERMATIGNMGHVEFRERYEYLVENEAPPIRFRSAAE